MLFVIGLIRLNNTDAHTQGLVNRRHPIGIAFRKVVVNRDYMHTVTRERIEISWQSCHKGFAFTGAHFGNAAFVQGDAANQLNIIMPHALGAFRCFPNCCEGLRQQRVK